MIKNPGGAICLTGIFLLNVNFISLIFYQMKIVCGILVCYCKWDERESENKKV